mmetsp:Transcript_5698/g.6580  ORF Transcript_5698/g.6580 Transcript_5698/m.6580 type:complete len:384 (-) Transcript_5698:160-1311(-)|eukprot:CAMPEP_0184007952 /NCGR_PEP_ID=MMETSP0954-20121128/1659_1 /TAXON_ID=627963 /ORGANISM="Aplanochytrium sp, Strain PBS07" /LENGTH=383 /DNA_ID=CAMNT_0026286919 /DNA_START=44 /DNA_END=1195 /DNA_ORIENTATION=+
MGEYGQYDIPTRDECVNFKIGQPAPSMLPLEKVRKAAAIKFAEEDPLFLQYGHIYGFPKFRESVAKFLTKRYGHEVDPEKLLATNGNTGGLAMICSLFCKAGDIVYCGEPTYFLAKRIFEDFNIDYRQIPMDKDGLDVDLLEKQLEQGPVPVMMYVVTTAHNPTGRTLTAERRKKLAELSAKYKFILVADEVYQLLTFPGIEPPPPMFTYDTAGTILALGSFSKILAPSLRVGWIQGSPELLKKIADCGQLDSSGGLNPIGFGIVQRFIDEGLLDEHLDETRKTLATRYETLAAALKKYLPAGCTFEVPQGGYFVLVTLPEGQSAADLLKVALPKKVAFLPGGGFAKTMGNCLRLSFSMYDAEDIDIGIQRLAEAIKEYQAGL